MGPNDTLVLNLAGTQTVAAGEVFTVDLDLDGGMFSNFASAPADPSCP